MKWLLVVLMLGACPGFAQKPARAPAKKAAPPVAPAKFPIESLRVDGNREYTEQQVISTTGLKLGQMAGKEDFEAARARLEASGAFDTAGFRSAPSASGKGYAVVFQVTEFRPVLPVKFHELGAPDAELTAALRAADPLFLNGRLPASQISINRATAALRAALEARKLDSNIAGTVESWPKDFAIVFRSRSALPAVAEVSFVGAKAVSEKELREAISGVAVGASYTEDNFRTLLDANVRPVFEARGLLRVEFPKVQVSQATDVKGLRVTVTVVDGDPYKLGAATIADDSPVKPEELLKAAAFKSGETANFDHINDGAESIRKALRRAGYMDAAVRVERTLHDAEKTVDIAVRLTPGALYQMGQLTIKGLDLSAEAEMRRMWTLKAGKPFNADYPDYFLSRIREQGVFDDLGDTKADRTVNASAHTVDVTLRFGAAPKAPERRRDF